MPLLRVGLGLTVDHWLMASEAPWRYCAGALMAKAAARTKPLWGPCCSFLACQDRSSPATSPPSVHVSREGTTGTCVKRLMRERRQPSPKISLPEARLEPHFESSNPSQTTPSHDRSVALHFFRYRSRPPFSSASYFSLFTHSRFCTLRLSLFFEALHFLKQHTHARSLDSPFPPGRPRHIALTKHKKPSTESPFAFLYHPRTNRLQPLLQTICDCPTPSSPLPLRQLASPTTGIARRRHHERSHVDNRLPPAAEQALAHGDAGYHRPGRSDAGLCSG